MMRYIYIAFWAIVVLIGISFTALNSHSVLIDYYFGNAHLELPVLLFIVLLLGIILGIIVMLPVVLRAKYQARRVKRRIKQTEQEVDNLRRMPIQESH
ncbi:MAG: lipopolysaccharide assembly protein LapA domain-containing protein [Coxiellaceae bacterium]|nr:lipopolysaccharide assembly protein LapA domain-containing protein [Coxiellaceae bacterium]